MEIDWFSVVAEVNRRKYGLERPQDPAEKAKRVRFLQSRGFNLGHVVAAVDGFDDV